jgi:general secretion pathway protein D
MKILRLSLILMIAAAGTSCTSSDGSSQQSLFAEALQNIDKPNNVSTIDRPGTRQIASVSDNNPPVAGVYYEGTGSFASAHSADIEDGVTTSGKAGYTLNLVDAQIKAAAKSVLGDTLGLNYAVDPRVTGTVSLQTSMPVARDDLVDLFETALSVSGASIIRQRSFYKIVPSGDVITSTPPVSIPSASPRGPGIRVQVIELRFIGADEMRAILEPISRQGSILRVDNTRNTIIISGTGQELQSIRDAISVFDVDWMRGQSIALHPLKNSKPAPVVAELEAVFSQAKESGLVRFVPNERMNSVLVIASKPIYLRRADAWLKKLDQVAPTNGNQLFVYEIQNRPAKELAEVLRAVLTEQANVTIPKASPPAVAPDFVATRFGDAATTEETANAPPPAVVEQGNLPETSSTSLNVPSVVADTENNSLLISTTPANYKRVEQILNQLDALPTQVMLEAVIAEVKLADELQFGLRWAIENGKISSKFSDLLTGSVAGTFPGASFGFVSDNIQVTLNALSSITDVNIVSSPTIMAMNNQKAILQVGDQVPIVTQQSENATSRLVNTIQLKDTGLILTVTPRINQSGRVLLDIDQEVSSVVKTTTSGIDSPTIQQRRLRTMVVVSDGESLALGGLIQERDSLERRQVPLLGDIPILGNIFKNKTNSIVRTELIIFIRPRIIRNTAESSSVMSEFKSRFNVESAMSTKRKSKSSLANNVKRLVY